MKRIAIFCVAITVFTYSCSYMPEGENFIDVEYINSFDQTLNLNEIEGDTIYLPVKKEFTYSVDGDYISESYVDVIIGEEEVKDHTKSKKRFALDPEDYQSGYYPLKIEINTRQAIGTLAHATNNSGYTKTLWKKWVVAINNELPDAAEIINIGEFDHQLRIEWKKYDNFTFLNYKLKKYVIDSTTGYKYYKGHWDIKDKDITSFVDSTFLSGIASYELSIQSTNGTSASSTKTFEYNEVSKIQYDIIDLNHIKLIWNKPRFYNSVSSYSFHNSQLVEIYNVNDTVYILEDYFRFGFHRSFNLYINSYESSFSYWQTLRQSVGAHLGKEIEPFNDLIYDQNADKLYAFGILYKPYLYLVDNKFHKIDSTRLPGYLNSSYDYSINYSVNYNNTITGFDFSIFSLNGKDHKIGDIVKNWWSTSVTLSVSNSISLSKDDLIALKVNSWNYVVDLKSEELIYKAKHNNKICITPKGSFLINNDSVYTQSNNKFAAVYELAVEKDYIDIIIPDDSEQTIIICYSDKFHIVNLNDGKIIKTVLFPSPINQIRFDKKNKSIGVYNNRNVNQGNYFFIIRVIDGNLIHKIPIHKNDRTGLGYFFANNQLISNSGYHVDLNEWE